MQAGRSSKKLVAVADGELRQRVAAAETQLPGDRGPLVLNCSEVDAQLGRDLLARLEIGDQPEDAELGRREALEPLGPPLRGRSLLAPGEERRRQARADVGPALAHGVDGLRDGLRAPGV